MPGSIPSGSKLTFQIATAAGAEVVARLITALNEAVGPDGVLESSPGDVLVTADQARARIEAMTPGEQVLLAFIDAEPVGLLSLRVVPYLSQDVPFAEVAELYVEPQHRRHGIAAMLMAQAEFLARDRGATAVHVRTWHTNEDAHSFYRSLGYESLEVGFNKYLSPKSSSRKRRAEG